MSKLYKKEGNEKLVVVEIGDAYLKVRAGLNFRREIGENVWMDFDWHKVYFFDERTEKVIIGG